MSKLVSVIIPTYNGWECIKRCVDSVLAQTYQNIEIIVVDDNGFGTDGQKKTAEVMREYAENPKVQYICHEKNRNGSAARNTGFSHSKGEYIALLDDDDEFLPDNILRHVDELEKLDDSYAMTYCGTEYFVGNQMDHRFIPSVSGSLLYELLAQKVVIGSSTLCIKRTAWDKVHGFDDSFFRHQDLEFTARVSAFFQIKALPYIGRKKYLLKRNGAKSPEEYKTRRLHYIKKMEPLIETLSLRQQKDVFGKNFSDIAFEYLKSEGICSFIAEYKRMGLGLYGINYILRRVCIILKRGKLRV